MNNFKKNVHDFWNNASCGEDLYLQNTDISGYTKQAQERYRLEPYIIPFAGFNESKNKKVLEIGVGLGADHQKFAETGADLFGVDLTERAVAHTRRRLLLFGLSSALCVGDAENLKFDDSSFDHVYSWGVLHHSPKTPKAINEVYRVLKKGGTGSNAAKFICDGLLNFETESLGGNYSRNLTIRKMRSTKNDDNLHPLEICDQGVKIHSFM